MNIPSLTLRDVRIRAVAVPLRRPLVTRVITIETAPFLLIDLETEEGITGRSYLFCYLPPGPGYLAPLIGDLLSRFKGQRLSPADFYDGMVKANTLFGVQGLTAMAASGLDMAYWDAVAQAANMPLASLLGGKIEPIRAYNSNGLGIIDPAAAADEVLELIEEGGYGAVKMRVGRERVDKDVAVIRAIRAAIGDQIYLPCDFNQCLDIGESIRRGLAFDDEGLLWIEEPTAYDDLKGNADIAAKVTTPISIGENFFGPRSMEDAIAAKAADVMMPDAGRIGGVTGWMRAAALAEAASIEMSSHIYPEISSHLLAVTPTRGWLEFVDWASPILAEPATVKDGALTPSQTPGAGITWNEDGISRFAVEF